MKQSKLEQRERQIRLKEKQMQMRESHWKILAHLKARQIVNCNFKSKNFLYEVKVRKFLSHTRYGGAGDPT